MTLEELASVGEMVGGLAVVLTLPYLAFETRRNTAVHIASTTSDAYVSWAGSKLLFRCRDGRSVGPPQRRPTIGFFRSLREGSHRIGHQITLPAAGIHPPTTSEQIG